MNFFDLLSEIEKTDPEVYGRLDSRRAVFKNMSGLGQKLAAAALPLAVGAVFNKAYAQTPAGLGVADVLNFALKLEYLEMYFYQQRSVLTGLSSVNKAALDQIASDETKHVAFLRTVIASLGATSIADPTAAVFDYTAKGKFPNYVTNANTYLALAQSFEDLGVRVYKGAAPLTAVMSNKTVLTAALSIHAVEARHASHIRAMRRADLASASPSQGLPISPYDQKPKSWISANDAGGAAPPTTLPIYSAGVDTGAATYGTGTSASTGPATGVTFPAEDNIKQGDLYLSAAVSPSFSNFPSTAFTEAFDEGLDVGTVARIANVFSTSGSYFG